MLIRYLEMILHVDCQVIAQYMYGNIQVVMTRIAFVIVNTVLMIKVQQRISGQINQCLTIIEHNVLSK